MTIIPEFLVATTVLGSYGCITWHQLGQDPLFIHEVPQKLLSLFTGCSVDKVLELHFAPRHSVPLYPYCYALPLINGQSQAHREYCRQAMNENKESIKNACLAFGILSIHKWIQTTKSGSWILYYQQMAAPIDKCRQKLFALQDDEKALSATKPLRQHTGCSITELCPYSERK